MNSLTTTTERKPSRQNISEQIGCVVCGHTGEQLIYEIGTGKPQPSRCICCGGEGKIKVRILVPDSR